MSASVKTAIHRATMPTLALLALVLVAGAASSAVLYHTSFELPVIDKVSH